MLLSLGRFVFEIGESIYKNVIFTRRC